MVEAVIAIALTSFVILALATGLLLTARSSASAKAVQKGDAAVSAFAESLKAMPYPTAAGACPTLNEFRAAYTSFPSRWDPSNTYSPTITGVEAWNPTTRTYGTTCTTDPRVHRLTIKVTVDGEEYSSQAVVGKR